LKDTLIHYHFTLFDLIGLQLTFSDSSNFILKNARWKTVGQFLKKSARLSIIEAFLPVFRQKKALPCYEYFKENASRNDWTSS
jgi:hypothetical protein